MAWRMDWRRDCGVSNYSEQIWIGVFGMINIHEGEGIGVGHFGWLSVPMLTLERVHLKGRSGFVLFVNILT